MLLFSFLLGYLDFSTASVHTIPSLVGLRGTKVTLECSYRSTDRWYVVQWKRVYTDSPDVTITTLTNTGKVDLMPLLEDGVGDDFKSRVRTSLYMDVNTLDFHISIHNFSCNDTGQYACDVISARNYRNTTELTIQAKPSRPTVLDDEVLLEVNDTYTLTCTAMAGIPAADLRWYYKLPGTDDFSRIDTETREQKNTQLSECSYRATQLLDVTVNEETDGIIYRCMVESTVLTNEETESFYDDVLIKIPIPEPEYAVPTTKPPAYKRGANTGIRLSGTVHSIITFLSILIIRLRS